MKSARNWPSILYWGGIRGENKGKMRFCWKLCWSVALALGGVLQVNAGGSGLNVVVVVNQSSSNSVELGNYYCEKRQVPPQNLLRPTWTGGNGTWTKTDFAVAPVASRNSNY